MKIILTRTKSGRSWRRLGCSTGGRGSIVRWPLWPVNPTRKDRPFAAGTRSISSASVFEILLQICSGGKIREWCTRKCKNAQGYNCQDKLLGLAIEGCFFSFFFFFLSYRGISIYNPIFFSHTTN